MGITRFINDLRYRWNCNPHINWQFSLFEAKYGRRVRCFIIQKQYDLSRKYKGMSFPDHQWDMMRSLGLTPKDMTI